MSLPGLLALLLARTGWKGPALPLSEWAQGEKKSSVERIEDKRNFCSFWGSRNPASAAVL